MEGKGDNKDIVEQANKLDKNDPGFVDDIKNDPASALAALGTAGAGLSAAAAEQQKAAMALRMAKEGALNRYNITPATTGLTPDHAALVRRQADLQGDPSLGIANYGSMSHPQQVAELAKRFKEGIPVEYINPEVFRKDPAVAQAANQVRGSELDRLQNLLSSDQKEAWGEGMAGAADLATEPRQKREFILRSAELGYDPEKLYARSGYNDLKTAGQNVQATINNVINNSPRYYVNQSGVSAIKMMSHVSDPAKAVGIMNSENLPDHVRSSIMGELRNPGSPINRNMRRLLLGNMETANQRNAMAMQKVMTQVLKRTKAAQEAAESAKAP